MVDVAGQGRTVLLCSHQVHEVERIADLVAILLQGELVCFERLEDLKQQVREFVFTLPMPTAAYPELPGTVLSSTAAGCEHSVMLRNLEEFRLSAWQAAGIPFQVRHPGLEEILLSLLRERRERGETGFVSQFEADVGTDSGGEVEQIV
jgi:ABC-2 type transport system ATP-binding protein